MCSATAKLILKQTRPITDNLSSTTYQRKRKAILATHSASILSQSNKRSNGKEEKKNSSKRKNLLDVQLSIEEFQQLSSSICSKKMRSITEA